MCIIIDANAAHHLNAEDPAGALVLGWLLKGKGKLVVSQDNLKELFKTKFKDVILSLDQARRVCRADEEKCNDLRDKFTDKSILSSDDPHVVALVVVSKCDLVFTHDQPLHEDLKNKAVVPGGCGIFQKATHRHMLGECNC